MNAHGNNPCTRACAGAGQRAGGCAGTQATAPASAVVFNRLVNDALGWVPPPRVLATMTSKTGDAQIRRIRRMWANGEEVCDIAEILSIDYQVAARYVQGIER